MTEGFTIKDVIYIVGIASVAVTTFFVTKHGIKEYMRDKYDALYKEMQEMKLTMKDLEHTDELQQQVIDQIGKTIDTVNAKLFDILDKKNKGGK